MRLRILAVGRKMPSWVQEGTAEYLKRLPKHWNTELLELPKSRQGNADLARQEEAAVIENARVQGAVCVALEVQGKALTTEALTQQLQQWQDSGRDVDLIIGGPDGLAAELSRRADVQLSLGRLTLPHPIVRIVLAEQLYRCWSLMSGHPYHR